MPEIQGPDNSSHLSEEAWKQVQQAIDRATLKAEEDFLLDRDKFLKLWVLSEEVTAYSQEDEMMALEAQDTPEANREWTQRMDAFSRQLAREHGLGEDEIITFQQRLGELFMEGFNNPSSPNLN